MKTLRRRVAVVSLLAVSVLPSVAAERVCSVYLESISALQMQVQKASEVFASPELGMFPMMMTMMVPGASQVNATEPVSLHLFDLGEGKVGAVVELTPATTPEMFLKSLIAASGKPLDPSVDGRFVFDGGLAQARGPRLLLAKDAESLDLCVSGAVPALPPMPALEGAIRVALAPSAMVPMLRASQSKVDAMMATCGGAEAQQAREMMTTMFGLYMRTMGQINALSMSVAVQSEGLMIRSHLVPVSGSTVEGIIASMQPIPAAYQSFVDADSMLSFASGSFVVSDQLKRQMGRIYAQFMKASPIMADVDITAFVAEMQYSIDALGGAMGISGGFTVDERRIQMQMAMGMPEAASYLRKMLALMQEPSYQSMMAKSGMKVSEPTTRDYKGVPVYAFDLSVDESALSTMIAGQGGAPDEASIASIKAVMEMFTKGYEYAATPQSVVFGMGGPAVVEKVIDRMTLVDAEVAPEAARIQALLAPSARPVSIGRFALLDAVRMVAEMSPEAGSVALSTAVALLPKGEGIVSADWREGSEIRSALLIPATDIKAISTLAKSMQSAFVDDAVEEADGREGMTVVEDDGDDAGTGSQGDTADAVGGNDNPAEK
ncbi:MAG TPA: hypothetical protein DCS43_13890 [Verrucomicrobia bacterium]|nr:hypothetical protein [Verrucomicrobiota bacterium]